MSDMVVQLRDVEKSFSAVRALESITLNVDAGEVLGLFGHNGAGKSTLMKLILGVIEPNAGEVLALGHRPTANGSHNYRRQFGYLPENVTFYDQLSGREVLRYFARLKGYKKNEAERLLADVGLKDAAGRAVKTYSKGMRQRLGLAQALLGNPRLLLLDEPTVGLDPEATSEFYTTVDRLKSGGCSVILCSHVLPGVEAHIDRAMILGAGKSLALGSLEKLRADAQLPVEIRIRGLSAEAVEEAIPSAFSTYQLKKTYDYWQVLLVPNIEKLSIMRQLIANPSLNDIELRQPSLEELYRHYISINMADSDKGLHFCHEDIIDKTTVKNVSLNKVSDIDVRRDDSVSETNREANSG